MEDSNKVKLIKDELNKGTKKEAWDDVVGIFMMPEVEFHSDQGKYSVNMAKGINVKIYTNIETGELKFFWAGKVVEGS